jgi:CRP-like cAMP-binding protein
LPSAPNLLLEALPAAERAVLAPHLTRIELQQHDVLFDLRDRIRYLYFALDAVVSLVVPLSTGEVIETAMAGRDGVIGATAGLNGRASLNRGIVQIGGSCLRCPVEPLKRVLRDLPCLRALLGGHEQALFAQAQQAAACNATHVIESRLGRWLLRAADLHGSDELPLTQEYIAQMLGVRRTSVTMIARTLQQAGMIRYTRGHIKLTDLQALRETACECYEVVRANYEELVQPPSSPAADQYFESCSVELNNRLLSPRSPRRLCDRNFAARALRITGSFKAGLIRAFSIFHGTVAAVTRSLSFGDAVQSYPM